MASEEFDGPEPIQAEFDRKRRKKKVLSEDERRRLLASLAISVEEAAGLLGIGRSHYYDQAKDGILPLRKIGHRAVVPVELLRRAIRDL